MAQSELAQEDVPTLNFTSTVTETSKWGRSVALAVPPEEVNKAFDAVAGDLASRIQLPGFRQGKVPRNIIEKRFGDDVRREVTNALIQRALTGFVVKEKIDVVGEPAVSGAPKAARGQAMEFTVELEVRPTFDLPQYKGVEVEQEEIEVLPEEFDQAVDRIRERFAETVDAADDHVLAMGDSAKGRLRFLVDGNEVYTEDDAELLVIDGHVFGAHAHLGAKYLEGAKKGEKRTVEETLAGTFPKEEFRGKKATIEFEVGPIRARKLPEVNEEFVTKLGFKTVDELKDRVRSSLLESIGNEIKDRTRLDLVNKIVSQVQFELPAKVAESAYKRNAAMNVQYLSRMGMPEAALAEKKEEILSSARNQAEQEVRRVFVLGEIAKRENIEVDETDMDTEIVRLARQQNVKATDLYNRMVSEGSLPALEADLKIRRTVEFLVENAEIKIVARKPAPKNDAHAHNEHAPHDHGHEHGHEHGHDCGHDHGHDCGHDHGGGHSHGH